MRGRVALVDLGSNAVRFALAHVIPGRSFRILHEARAQTRLAAGRRGALTWPAIAATVAATRRFLGRVNDGRPLRVVAIATSAVREAPNAADSRDVRPGETRGPSREGLSRGDRPSASADHGLGGHVVCHPEHRVGHHP